MNYEDVKKIINDLLQNHSSQFISVILLSKKYESIFLEIKQFTSFLSNECKIIERIYCFYHNITKVLLCCKCNERKSIFYNFLKGYSKYCPYCSRRSIEKLEKGKNTNLKKYNVEWSAQAKIVKDKKNKTNLGKYGNICCLQNEEIHKKTVISNKEKFGVEFVFQSKVVNDKSKETNIKKYGTEYAIQNEEIKRKAINSTIVSNLKKYGVKSTNQLEPVKEKKKTSSRKKYNTDHVFQSEIVKNKSYNTMIERYGAKTTLESSFLRSKVDNTMIEKYGVINNMKNDILKEKVSESMYNLYGCNWFVEHQKCEEKRKIFRYNYLERFNEYSLPLFSINEFHGISKNKFYKWKCVKCNFEFECDKIPLCPKCFSKSKFKSKPERDIVSFLNKIGFDCLNCNRSIISPLEIDIYIETKKIAIEFDGLYWHSQSLIDDINYHRKKTDLCKNKEIHLIHIFEDEWILKRRIVENRLKSILGKIKRKIFARKCEIKEIDYQTKSKFLNKYHLQSNDNSKIFLGLFFKNRLVSVMTFSKLRIALGQKNKEGYWELARFCSVFNFNTVGAAGKLLSYFVKKYQPKEITSYADRRWSNGNLYEKLGFTLDHISQPNYWYLDGFLKRIHRFNFRKNVLKDKLKIFDPNLSEWENMQNNGYDRIWDCGNLVYKLILEQIQMV